jgi:hypothetical protein
VARIYRAVLKAHHDDGTLIEPSVHYLTDVPTAGSEPDPDDIASGVHSLIGEAYRQTLHSTCTYDDVIVTEMVLPPAIGASGSHHVGAAGGVSSAAYDLPKALVPIVNLHTGVSSRSARGWLMLGGPGAEAATANQKWTGAFLTAYQAFAALLDNSFDLGSVFPTHVNPVVYSRTRHRRGTDPHHFRVTGASASDVPHWLRSRMSSP